MAVLFDSSTYDMGIDGIGDPVILRNMASFTISVWIYPRGWGESSYGRIAQKGTSGAYGWLFFLDDINVDESISFVRYRVFTDTTVRAAAYSISLNEWQHVLVAHQSSSTEIYVNGVEVSYDTQTAGSGNNDSDQFDEFVAANREELSRGFYGEFEDFRVYDRHLSAGEAGQLYASRGRDGIWQDRILHWPLREKAPGVSLSTDPVKNITTNSLNGTSMYSGTVAAEGIVRKRRVA